MGFSDWLTDFIPDEDPEAPPEQNRARMRNWRKRLALVACSSWLTLFFGVIPTLVVLLFTGAPVIGQVAWSADQDRKTDAKILAANDPLVKELNELKIVQKTQGAILRELATASLRESICRYAARRILERDVNERARLLDEIETMKQKYTEYSGQIFNTADC